MTIFLSPIPEGVTLQTRLVDICEPEFALKALKESCISIKDLKSKLDKHPERFDPEEISIISEQLKHWKIIRAKRKKTPPSPKSVLPPANPHIVPLEKLSLGLGLDGKTGTNRADDHVRSLEATDDIGAVNAWLCARAVNRNTQGVYRKEAERFLLWCTQERELAMSSAGLQEASLYLRWLEQLGRLEPKDWAKQWKLPQCDWIGAKNTPREDPAWRPFNGPLSQPSRKMSVTVIRQLFNFLHKTGYIIYNPFDQISHKVPFLEGEGAPKEFADRAFSPEQWAVVTQTFEAMNDDEAHARLGVVLMLGKGLGLRASEMLNARADWIVTRRIDNELINVLEVIGKGDKARRLPLQDEQIALINHYFNVRGIAPLGLAPADTPLLASLGRGRQNTLRDGMAHRLGLSRSGLYRTLDTFFKDCAANMQSEHPLDAAKFRASSTHWLRHTFASSALQAMPVNVVQSAMGHASISTTSLYLTPEEAQVARGMKKMKTFSRQVEPITDSDDSDNDDSSTKRTPSTRSP